MGRRGRGGKRGNDRNRNGGGSRSDNRQGGGYQGYPEIEKANKDMEAYYNDELRIIPDETERAQFWESFKTTLPNSFRFTGSKGHALTVQKTLVKKYLPQISSITWEGQTVEPPTQLQWFPNQLAWSMTTSKQVIRKFPPFAAFQKFLVSETTIGNISRQEVVSMIPPLLLDVYPHMTVLDMCAAPGSKSAQLAEMIHGGEEARIRQVVRKIAAENGRSVSPDGAEVEKEKSEAQSEDDYSDDGRSTGLLVANEIEWKRAQLLVHQIKRLNSPNYIVTNHDARSFPSILMKAEEGHPREYLKFDRILADVPCTGDGTLRKNVNIWKDWTRQNALGLHVTQLQILVRALQMLKVGGKVVYSTCSLNVIENESVIAAAIDKCGGSAAVRIVDCSDKLPGLIRRPGLITWPVVDRAGRAWASWEETEKYKTEHGEEGFSRVVETMFPPRGEEAEPLQRCMRFYPHLQDTGGFFVVVLEKLTEIRKLRDPPSKRAAAASPQEVAMDDVVLTSTSDGVEAEALPHENPLDILAEAPGGEQNGVASLGEVPTDLKPISPLRPATDATEPQIVPPQHPLEASIPSLAISPKRAREDDNDADADELSKRQKTLNGSSAQRADRPPKRGAPREEPFKYLDPEHSTLQEIHSFYKLSSRFPKYRWMVRNATGEPVKAIYYTSDLARKILVMNEGTGIKFVHCGVKMFVKQDVPNPEVCRWRIQSEGMPIIEPWIGHNRIVRLHKRQPLYKLLRETFCKVKEDAKDLGEIAEQLADMPMGCCILKVEADGTEDGFEDRMVLPLWKSIFSLQLMLPKEDRKAMLLRIFDDDTPLVDHNKVREEKLAQAAELVPTIDDEDDVDGGVAVDEEPYTEGGVALASGEAEDAEL